MHCGTDATLTLYCTAALLNLLQDLAVLEAIGEPWQVCRRDQTIYTIEIGINNSRD